jgi:hypothetical protein
MIPGKDIERDIVYIIEYTGGEAKLAAGQMEKPWVEEKIAELRAMKGNKMATDMAERLDKALKEGRLIGPLTALVLVPMVSPCQHNYLKHGNIKSLCSVF